MSYREDYKEALHHHREFERLKEEVLGEESATRLKNLQIKLEAEAVETLKQAQASLVQSEKMAALGKLVAGIAHEFNSPVGAIRSSVDVAARALKKLLASLGKSQNDTDRTTLETLEQQHRTLATAGERLERIVTSLRRFIRLDEAQFQLADVHEGIDATLELLEAGWGDRIRIVRRFGDLPEIEAYPSELNQALMTVLMNAGEAIEGEGSVTIATAPDNDSVRIAVSDSGRGIPEAQQPDRIYTPNRGGGSASPEARNEAPANVTFVAAVFPAARQEPLLGADPESHKGKRDEDDGGGSGDGNIRRLISDGKHIFVIIDVAMPSSTGDNFQGGFELTERLHELDVSSSVMLMTEYLSSKMRARARELGVNRVAFKPALTKLDADDYEADLRSFAKVVRRELVTLAQSTPSATEADDDAPTLPSLNYDVMFDFLKTMTDQLVNPGNGIARMILRVAAKHAERAFLFLVKGPRARGLAGVHLGRPNKQVVEQVSSLAFDLQSFHAFAEVVYSGSPLLKRHERDELPEGIEPGKAGEYVLLPMQHNHEVLAILYCDNPNSGRAPTRLAGLELFLAQAGMAMEERFTPPQATFVRGSVLNRKSRTIDSRAQPCPRKRPLTWKTKEPAPGLDRSSSRSRLGLRRIIGRATSRT